jgi:hypothetical protein
MGEETDLDPSPCMLSKIRLSWGCLSKRRIFCFKFFLGLDVWEEHGGTPDGRMFHCYVKPLGPWWHWVCELRTFWKVSSSGMCRRVVCWVATDVSEEHIASTSSMWAGGKQSACWNYFLRPWRWRRYVPPKRRLQLSVITVPMASL